MSFIPIVLIGIAIVIFITILILVTISLAQVNSNRSDDSSEDKERYSSARNYLGWAVGIGWTIIALSIILIILAAIGAIFLLPEELAVAAIPNIGGGGKEGATNSAIVQLDKYRRKIRSGFLGFRSVFNSSGFVGFLTKFSLFIILALLFAFGILATLAAYEIGKTSSRRGYKEAIWAAVLGIVPLSFIIIWAIANYFYVKAEKEEAIELYNEISAKLNEIEMEKYKKKNASSTSSTSNLKTNTSTNTPSSGVTSDAPNFSDTEISPSSPSSDYRRPSTI